MFRLILSHLQAPFFKNTDPYYQLVKCIMGSQSLTIFLLRHCMDVGYISSTTWIEYTAYTFFKIPAKEVIYTYTSKICKI
jgi:hypothetical protein